MLGVIVGGAGTASLLMWPAGTARPGATQIPPICVTVHNPGGSGSFQIGYSPHGPQGCYTLPPV